MAILTVAPLDHELKLVTPTSRFTAVSEREYQNFFAGQRVDLNLYFNNLPRERFGQLLSEVSRLVEQAPAGDPHTGTRSTYINGGYYIWVPFAVLGKPTQAANTATITAISGGTVTGSRNIPASLRVGDWITMTGQPLLVQAISVDSITVSPRPRYAVAGANMFPAEQGGWFVLKGELPEWRYRLTSNVEFGAPYTLKLAGVV